MIKRILFILVVLIIETLNLSAATKYKRATGNWSSTTDWSNTAGGSSCGCIPSSSDTVVINFNTTVNNDYTCAGISVASGVTLTIGGGNTLTSTRGATFTSCTVTGSGTDHYISVAYTVVSTGTTYLSGTTKNLYLTAAKFSFGTSTFLGNNTYITKTGNSNDTWPGGNAFGANVATTVHIINNSTGNIVMANASADTYVGSPDFDNRSSGKIYVAYNGGSQTFSEDVYLKSTGTGGIYFSYPGGTGTCTLATGKKLIISSVNDVTQGTIQLSKFTQNGTTNINTCNAKTDGSATIIFGPTATFNGQCNLSFPNIKFSGVTFTSNTLDNLFEVTNIGNSSTCASLGNSTFGSVGATNTTIFRNLTNGTWILADTTASTYRSNVEFRVDATSSTSGAKIIVCDGLGSDFYGNIQLNSTAAGCGTDCYREPAGIWIEGSSSNHCQLASGKTITAGANGIKAGTIQLKYFDQLGTTSQLIATTCTSISNFVYPITNLINTTWAATGTGFEIRPNAGVIQNSTFAGNFTCDVVQSDGHTVSTSGNIYSGTATFINNTVSTFSCTNSWQSSSVINVGTGTKDSFNLATSFRANGCEAWITVASAGTTYFNEDITYYIAGGDASISIGSSSSAAKLKSGKTLISSNQNGGACACDYTYTGDLTLTNFTQLGTAAMTLTATTNSQTNFISSTIGGNLSVTASMFNLKNSRFNGATSSTFVHSGAGLGWCAEAGFVRNSTCYGGNVFNSATTTFHSDSRFYFGTAQSANDSINGFLVVGNTTAPAGCGAYPSGILFGGEDGTGITYLKQGKTITTLGGTTFDIGRLSFRNFIHGNAAGVVTNPLIALTADASIYYENGSRFYCNWSSESPHFYLNGSTFDGTTTITRIAPNNHYLNTSYGGCTFNGAVTIRNDCTNDNDSIQLAGTTGDTYNNNVTFYIADQTDADGLYAKIQPAYKGTNSFKGNITINGGGGTTPDSTTFGWGGGTVLINGTTAQSIDVTGNAYKPLIKKLTVDKSSGNFTLNTAVDVENTLTLTNGLVVDDIFNLLTLKAGSTATSTANSFVTGPVKKIGNTEFYFPIGSLTPKRWARAGIIGNGTLGSAITSGAATDEFLAQYYYGTSPSYDPHDIEDAGLHHVSYVEYWTVQKTTGTGTPKLRFYWEDKSTNGSTTGSGIDHSDLGQLAVAHWKTVPATGWYKEGTATATATSTTTGYVTTNAVVSSFSPFTFGSTTSIHPLPVGLLSFTGEIQGAANMLKWSTATETNNDYFMLERSVDGIKFSDLAKIDGAGNSTQTLNYQYVDEDPFYGITYYRLKQVDFNGDVAYSNIVSLNNNKGNEASLNFFPNPSQSVDAMQITINGVLLNSVVKYSVYNNLGQKISEGSFNHEGKYSLHPFSTLSNNLAPGNYTVSVVMDNKIYKNNIIIK